MTAKNTELTEAVGRLLIIGFEEDFSEAEKLILEIRPAGLIFFRRNYPAEKGGRKALRAFMQAAQKLAENSLGRRLFMAIDHEGGSVQRLPAPYAILPSAQDMAQKTPAEAREIYEQAGKELAETGFNLNFAPVLDLAPPDSPVLGTRCFSNDPSRVAEYGEIALNAYRAAGVLTCGKHFPGLGSAVVDPHYELPAILLESRRLWEVETAPFRLLAECGLPAIMTTHALYPSLDEAHPATFSGPVVDMLKHDMGFLGPVVTDDLEMGAVVKHFPLGEAAVRAVAAGHDLALVCRKADYVRECAEALARAVESGRVSAARLSDAHRRSARLFSALHQQRDG